MLIFCSLVIYPNFIAFSFRLMYSEENATPENMVNLVDRTFNELFRACHEHYCSPNDRVRYRQVPFKQIKRISKNYVRLPLHCLSSHFYEITIRYRKTGVGKFQRAAALIPTESSIDPLYRKLIVSALTLFVKNYFSYLLIYCLREKSISRIRFNHRSSVSNIHLKE